MVLKRLVKELCVVKKLVQDWCLLGVRLKFGVPFSSEKGGFPVRNLWKVGCRMMVKKMTNGL